MSACAKLLERAEVTLALPALVTCGWVVRELGFSWMQFLITSADERSGTVLLGRVRNLFIAVDAYSC